MDKNKKLRVGIIGTGGIANPHLDSYLKLDNVEVVAGADLVPGKAEEFFRAFAVNAGLTLHLKVLYGKNDHHKLEALYKALGLALRDAASIDNRIEGVLSTKGSLD